MGYIGVFLENFAGKPLKSVIFAVPNNYLYLAPLFAYSVVSKRAKSLFLDISKLQFRLCILNENYCGELDKCGYDAVRRIPRYLEDCSKYRSKFIVVPIKDVYARYGRFGFLPAKVTQERLFNTRVGRTVMRRTALVNLDKTKYVRLKDFYEGIVDGRKLFEDCFKWKCNRLKFVKGEVKPPYLEYLPVYEAVK